MIKNITYKVCPNCGEPWKYWESEDRNTPAVSACCGCSAEFLQKLSESPAVSLSVKLAELERKAKSGADLPAAEALMLIDLLRNHMAVHEEARRRIDQMIEVMR